jgi:D-xylose transport system substrate-binding protein
MRKGLLFNVVTGLLAVTMLAGCGLTGNDPYSGRTTTKRPYVGVILPDSKSSARWEADDRRFLASAFTEAGVDYDIQNALGDKTAFQTIADQMITNGVNVLMIVDLDAASGKAALDKAKSSGVATIDYDRLTLGGSAEYYVSFDNTKVGQLQGEGLQKCLTEMKASKPLVAELNGAQTDNNATLFKQGYDAVLKPLYDSGTFVKGPDKWVPEWDNAQATNIFSQMLAQNPKISGVLAANDGLGNAAIGVLRKAGRAGKVPVTGQDATVQGLQNILDGDQCMTVYKPVKEEALRAADLAITLAKGQKKDLGGSTVRDPVRKQDVPAVLLQPKAITKDTVKDVVADGDIDFGQLCTGQFVSFCAQYGVVAS